MSNLSLDGAIVSNMESLKWQRTNAQHSCESFTQPTLSRIPNQNTQPSSAPSTTIDNALFNLFSQYSGLPTHDIEAFIHLIDNKEYSIADFFNIFQNRLKNLFYDTWDYQRHHLPNLGNTHSTPFFTLAKAFAHFKANTTSESFFAAHYAHLLSAKHMSAEHLSQLLTRYFQIPINIKPHQQRWLRIHKSDQSRLSKQKNTFYHNQLGSSFILGKKTWAIQNAFTVLISAPDFETLNSLFPCHQLLEQMKRIIQGICGHELECIIKVSIQPQHIQPCLIRSKNSFRLGWNTWLGKNKHNRPIQPVLFISNPLTSRKSHESTTEHYC